MSQRFRNICVTSFNTNEDYLDEIKLVSRYVVWQLEKCPTSLKCHFQIYIQLKNQMRFSGIKSLLPGAHIEGACGDPISNKKYCTKDESRIDGPWEFGEMKASGKRNDLEAIAHKILNKDFDATQVAECYPSQFIRYHKGFDKLIQIRDAKKQEFRKLDVIIYWGGAGSGKTRAATSISDDYYMLDNSGDTLWFDGYAGESVLIIDDFYGWIKYNYLLRMLDGYILRCPIKGGFIYAKWKTVVITSNNPPAEWYSKGLTSALDRRISRIIELNKPNSVSEVLGNTETNTEASSEPLTL